MAPLCYFARHHIKGEAANKAITAFFGSLSRRACETQVGCGGQPFGIFSAPLLWHVRELDPDPALGIRPSDFCFRIDAKGLDARRVKPESDRFLWPCRPT